MRRIRKHPFFRVLVMLLAGLMVDTSAPAVWAANHREAPITALDHKADITDVYAFRSYNGNDSLNRVTFILDVDPLLEPGNGPTWFPFDPEILYAIRIDDNRDAEEDITFEFRFKTEFRQPGLLRGLWQSYAGLGAGVDAPGNSPPPVAPGTPVIPPRITALNGAGTEGLVLRQTYEITMVRERGRGPKHHDWRFRADDDDDDDRPRRHTKRIPLKRDGNLPLFAVPTNAGPRTMNYTALFNEGIYEISGGKCTGMKVWAGTADDPFWIDLGGAFDTLNTSFGPVLTPTQDAALVNFASDTVSGYNVNAIAIDVPIECLTRTGQIEDANSRDAVIGVWGTTSRPRTKVLPKKPGGKAALSGNFVQIQRMGNALINELLIGNESKDKFSMSDPEDDAQFADFLLDPLLARVLNAATGIDIPEPPRTDLIPLVRYAPPICPTCPAGGEGPIADLLRLNTGVPATDLSSRSRLGLLGGDAAGYPNGRRLEDDVVDISLRAVAGVLNPVFDVFPNNKLGDGVNVNDRPYRTVFPYLADAHSGRNRRHIDPGEPGCTAGGGAACAP